MSKYFSPDDFQADLSRRDFLKVCGLGLAGLMVPIRLQRTLNIKDSLQKKDVLLGRVTLNAVKLYDKPSLTAEVIQEMELDSLWRITRATISEDEGVANRVWYELDEKGFAYSGWIQPVRQIINDGKTNIPAHGCLGEITMPFVDAYTGIEEDRTFAYRFYYGATFWILKWLRDKAGSLWYQLLDDRYYSVYYVPAYYIRLVPSSELTPISPKVDSEDKKIIIDLDTQTLTAYESEKLVYMSRVSSGVRLKEGGFATPKGHYRTYRKRPCRHMATPPSEFGSGFDLPGVPWVSYFTSDGIALHGAYWHNDFGVPHSHGCVNLTPRAAKWIYRWTTPTVPNDRYFYADENGTRVIIQ
ncbi:MAG: L,D-transpeptidase [Anaerolineales bacterium]